MARTVVVYDKGDVVGHYEEGIGEIVDREEVGDLTVKVRFKKSDRNYVYIEPYKIYLIEDRNGRITGRTLRVYMNRKETVDWANLHLSIAGDNRRAVTTEDVYSILNCRIDKWLVIDTEYSNLSKRLQNLLEPVKDKHLVVAIRRTEYKTTVVVGEYQSNKGYGNVKQCKEV